MSYEVIVLAAGSGKRMQQNQNKMFLEIEHRAVLLRTLDCFVEDEQCTHIIIVGKADEMPILKAMTPVASQKVSVVSGGAERQDSVFEGLKAVQNKNGIVFIHDGARPFIKKNELATLLDNAKSVKAQLLGVAVKDTVKKVKDDRVSETIERRDLYLAQTPQVFHYEVIYKAHLFANQMNYLGTDDVSLVEKFLPDVFVKLVEGSYDNIKITTPEDLYFAEAILKKWSMKA